MTVWFGSMTSAGPRDAMACAKRLAQPTPASCQTPREKNRVFRAGAGRGSFGGGDFFLRELRAAADGLDRDRLDHEFFGVVDEAEAGAMRGLEGRLHRVERH